MNVETPRFCTILESYYSDLQYNQMEGSPLLNISSPNCLSYQNSPKKEVNENKCKIEIFK